MIKLNCITIYMYGKVEYCVRLNYIVILIKNMISSINDFVIFFCVLSCIYFSAKPQFIFVLSIFKPDYI